ncbi:hypothetical protein CK203_062909 [Vitis vinifera]|uniref:Retrovirus-related Pol polyprotein from transposon TNT 1-94-like beta-barrel domain-containing protein n=1 Tax=Vitis vinifera TaxID=29760 RepID=A0A438FST1_VITVI|nr:hypothetical protein CK203_062909 [Vitis vinifera]
MLPSARSGWLVTAATSSFQLRIAHRLKHWIVDFLRFEMQQGGVKVVVEELQDEELFVVSCFATNSSPETWLIDSGCTNHMTYDKGLFKKLDKTVPSKVRIGNGVYLVVKGKGTVAIEGHTGLKLIFNVLYVPEINQNMLSVGQLLEKGYKVLFEDNHCMIADA